MSSGVASSPRLSNLSELVQRRKRFPLRVAGGVCGVFGLRPPRSCFNSSASAFCGRVGVQAERGVASVRVAGTALVDLKNEKPFLLVFSF